MAIPFELPGMRENDDELVDDPFDKGMLIDLFWLWEALQVSARKFFEASWNCCAGNRADGCLCKNGFSRDMLSKSPSPEMALLRFREL